MYRALYIKTNYSLLSSLVSIDNLLKYAKKENVKSMAVCDDDLTSTMVFYKACKKNGIKPIIGLDLKYEGLSILLYAKNYEGYHSLIKLSTIKIDREITLDDLKKYNGELICIVPFQSRNLFSILNEVYSDIYMGTSNKEEEQQAYSYTKNTVFINKILYINKNLSSYLKYLFMIRDGKTISDNVEFDDDNNYFLKYEEVINLASNEAINNTIAISDACNLEFIYDKDLLPIFETKDHDSDKYLQNLSIKGLEKRCNGNIPDDYKKRLLYELDTIKKMGFSNYFLVVYDFIKYAKKNGILVGPGRGSAGGSLVAYSLGIIDIDPIKYDLLFERFLNPERVTMPDIDTDFPDIYRDQVINYVKSKYGEKRVSGIVTFGTEGVRIAIRDVGRILNIKNDVIDRLSKLVPSFTKESIEHFYRENSDFKDMIDSDDKLSLLYRICRVIEGFPRHTSMHAAGIVMSRKDLDEVIPLVKNSDIYLTAFTMEHLEEIGLLKMDFLGLKNLTTIMNVIKDIETGENIKIDFSKIPLDDEKALNVFTRVDTSGIFQFESDGMKNFLRKLRPTTFEDIVAAIALFRPGPAGMIDTYIRRKHNEEKVTYLDPSLEPILNKTYGIIIYQEQIMQIASAMAGFTLGEADVLRRAMSKKKMELLKSFEEKFIRGSIERGHSEQVSHEVYDLIMKFANYGFNRSHSVAYSVIAYKMAYLKAHFPKYFFANLLSSVIGNETKTKEYLNEARALQIKVLLPDIKRSTDRYEVVEEGLLYPLSNIKNVGSITCHDILLRRDNYTDIFDCISKVVSKNVSKKTLEALIDTSCFRSFGYNNRTLNENLDNLLNYANLAKDLDPSLIIKPEIEEKEEYSKEILMANEKELFGLYLSDYPTTIYKSQYRVINLNEIDKYFNREIDIIVLVDRIKTIKTKKGEDMAFVAGSDESGNVDLTFFPLIYQKYKVKRGNVILVRGRVERRLDKYQLVVNKLKVLYE